MSSLLGSYSFGGTEGGREREEARPLYLTPPPPLRTVQNANFDRRATASMLDPEGKADTSTHTHYTTRLSGSGFWVWIE